MHLLCPTAKNGINLEFFSPPVTMYERIANLQCMPWVASFEWIMLIFGSLSVHVNEADH